MEYDVKEFGNCTTFEDANLTLEKKRFHSLVNEALCSKEREADDAKRMGNMDEYNAHLYYCLQLREVLNMTINDIEDLHFAEWIFNGGNLRSGTELAEMHNRINGIKFEERQRRIIESEEYNKGYHPVAVFFLSNILTPIILSLFCDAPIAFIFCYAVFCNYFGCVPLFIPGTIITFFYCGIHNNNFGVTSSSTVRNLTAISIAGCISSYVANKKMRGR